MHDDLTTRVTDHSIAGKDIQVDIITPEDVKKEEEKKSGSAMAVAALGAAALVAIGVAAVKIFFSDKDDNK